MASVEVLKQLDVPKGCWCGRNGWSKCWCGSPAPDGTDVRVAFAGAAVVAPVSAFRTDRQHCLPPMIDSGDAEMEPLPSRSFRRCSNSSRTSSNGCDRTKLLAAGQPLSRTVPSQCRSAR
uniref:Uncharacterized protein n=1 Tax=Anopheles christyi TaxID=43041 RepID=A0A182KIM4_9DIPT